MLNQVDQALLYYFKARILGISGKKDDADKQSQGRQSAQNDSQSIQAPGSKDSQNASALKSKQGSQGEINPSQRGTELKM